MFSIANLFRRRNTRNVPPTFEFSHYTDHQLKRATLHFSSSVSTGRFVFNDLQCAIEECLTEGHPRYSTWMDLPGPSAWKMVVDYSAYKWPFAAEIVYTISSAEREPSDVPHIAVEYLNIEVKQLPLRKAA